MGSQFDLFERAAACASMLKLASDPTEQQALKQLRELWKSLADERMHLSPEALADEIERLEEIQSRLGIFAHKTDQ
jgi:hypothetical protein